MEKRKRLLTVAQVAERLGVSPQTVRRWADQGFIPVARTPGGQRRFDPDQIDAVAAGMTPQIMESRLGEPVTVEGLETMDKWNAWDKFQSLSEADKDAVHAALAGFLNMPASKAQRYPEAEWGAITELSKATLEKRRPRQSSLEYLTDFLPGEPRRRTYRNQQDS